MMVQWLTLLNACTPSAGGPPAGEPAQDTAPPTADTGEARCVDTGEAACTPEVLPANWMNPHGGDQHVLLPAFQHAGLIALALFLARHLEQRSVRYSDGAVMVLEMCSAATVTVQWS